MYAFLDSTDKLDAKTLKQAGFNGALKYSFNTSNFPNKTWTDAEIKDFHAHGLKVAMCFESGNTQDHFTADQGTKDATQLVAAMHARGFPQGVGIGAFMTFDLDVQITPQVISYMTNARKVILAGGYLPGAYGDGALFDVFSKLGICHYFWLTQSKGFPGYDKWAPLADIVQNLTTPLHLSADGDEARLTHGSKILTWAW